MKTCGVTVLHECVRAFAEGEFVMNNTRNSVQAESIRELYSFDVFDTLIARQIANPQAAWNLLEDYINEDENDLKLSKYVRENFRFLRRQSEILTKFRAGRLEKREDVSLSEIYATFGLNSGFDARTQYCLCALERKLEASLLCPIMHNIKRVKSLVNEGKRVVLISGMYLEEETIRMFLKKIDLVFEEIPIYVSSAYSATKESGKLYQIVWEKEGKPGKWFHFGDNVIADVSVPRKFGIQCELYTGGRLLPFEIDVNSYFKDNYLHQLSVGTARLLRSKEKRSIAYEVGCSLGGVILYSYVNWILQECQRKDIRRLYFIARDGYLPKKIADAIIEQDWLPIKTKYLYGSHKTWNLASLSEKKGDFSRLVYSMNPQNITSVSDFAIFLDIPLDELKVFFPKEYDGTLSMMKLANLIDFLDDNQSFRSWILKKYELRRKYAINYLLQEIDTCDEHFAFVEINGTGHTQERMAALLQSFYPHRIVHFYCTMFLGVGELCKFFIFLPGWFTHVPVLEGLSRACHECTTAIREENGHFFPVLDGTDGAALKEYGYDDYIKGVTDFCRAFHPLVKKYNAKIDMDYIISIFHSFLAHVESPHTQWIMDLPVDVWKINGSIVRIAPKLTKKEIRELFLIHPDEALSRYQGGDFNLSISRCSATERKKIQKYKKNREKILARYYALYEINHK